MGNQTQGYDAWAVAEFTVGATTAVEFTTGISGRDCMVIHNNSANHLYIGPATNVTKSGGAHPGIHIGPGLYYGHDVGPGAKVWGIFDTGSSNNVSIAEYA